MKTNDSIDFAATSIATAVSFAMFVPLWWATGEFCAASIVTMIAVPIVLILLSPLGVLIGLIWGVLVILFKRPSFFARLTSRKEHPAA